MKNSNDVYEYFRDLHADKLADEAGERGDTKQISIRIGGYELALADTLAKDLGISRNAVISSVVEEGIWLAIAGAGSVMKDAKAYHARITQTANELHEKELGFGSKSS